MALHSYNHGIVTSSKGIALEAFKVAIGAAGAVGAITQSSSNLVASVVRSSIGLYLVTLNKPYPPRLVSAQVTISQPVPGANSVVGWVRNGSYSASAGTFQIDVSDLETPAADDPDSGSEIMVQLIFDRYTRT